MMKFHISLWFMNKFYIFVGWLSNSQFYRSMEGITSPIPQQVFFPLLRVAMKSPKILRQGHSERIPSGDIWQGKTKTWKLKQKTLKSNSQGWCFRMFLIHFCELVGFSEYGSQHVGVFLLKLNGQRNGISSSRWLVFLFFPFFQSILRYNTIIIRSNMNSIRIYIYDDNIVFSIIHYYLI